VEPLDRPSVETRDEEAFREQRWHWFECECREFAALEPDGFAAVLRAVSRAMKEQRELMAP
jgi:hypothetical protein